MAQIQEKLELADLAFQGENFGESYRLYSSVLEEDLRCKPAWIGKALSAAWRSTADNPGMAECAVCLRKAGEFSLSATESAHIANGILGAAERFVSVITDAAEAQLLERDKRPMSADEGYVERGITTIAHGVAEYAKRWESYEKTIEFAKSALLYDSGIEVGKRLLKLVDTVTLHGQQFNTDVAKNRLSAFRQEVIGAIKTHDQSFEAEPAPTRGACFIATAACGSYEADEVVVLREYRDRVMIRTAHGRIAIDYYYRFSPPLARFIGRHNMLRRLVRISTIQPIARLASARLRRDS